MSIGSTTVLRNAGSFDVLVARYDADGNLQWATRQGGVSLEFPNGLAELSDNSWVVAGYFTGTLGFGAGAPISATGGSSDVFLARLVP